MRMSLNSTLYYGCRSNVPNLGGNANNGSNCGFAYANFENDPANSNPDIGSRNCRRQIKKSPGPHLLVKNNKFNGGLVAEAKDSTEKQRA